MKRQRQLDRQNDRVVPDANSIWEEDGRLHSCASLPAGGTSSVGAARESCAGRRPRSRRRHPVLRTCQQTARTFEVRDVAGYCAMNEDGEAAWERMDKAHAYRLALLAGGYVPIPLNGKRPTNTAWQSDVAPDESEIASWKTTCGNAFNTGILTKWTPAIDIDVTDGVVANAIADRAAELIDEDAPLLVPYCFAPTSRSTRSERQISPRWTEQRITSKSCATASTLQHLADIRKPQTSTSGRTERRAASGRASYPSSPKPWPSSSSMLLATSCVAPDGKKKSPSGRPKMARRDPRLRPVKVAIANVNTRRPL